MLSIVGVILNIKKKRAGFLFWIVANGAWAIVDFKSGLPAQGALFIVYVILAVCGYFAWQGNGGTELNLRRIQGFNK